MSDTPRPWQEPEPDPVHVVEEPISRPEVPWHDPFYDGMEGEEEDEIPRRMWDGTGWPSPDMWWP